MCLLRVSLFWWPKRELALSAFLLTYQTWDKFEPMCLLIMPSICCSQLHNYKTKQGRPACLQFHVLFDCFFCFLRASDSMDRQNNMPVSTLKHVPNLSPGPCGKVELPDVSTITGANFTSFFLCSLPMCQISWSICHR